MCIVSQESYPDIPVSQHRERIIAAMREHQIIVVVGDTGSGKTTQLPKMALEYVASLPEAQRKLVGCTQPRRIAAASVSKRVAEELKVEHGQEVGYQVRFEDQSNKNTQLKFMTDGILLAETQGNVKLEQYSVLIIDEAHERSLNIDFLLGYLKRLLTQRPDLRVLISSATLDAGAFAEFFDDCPIIEVEGRTFPVETHYLPNVGDRDLAQHVIEAVEWIKSVDTSGDVLVFLPGEREIRECADSLEGRHWARTEVLPLFARLGLAEQQRVFRTISGVQRIVLATNVAETSLTIPGIVYVVDSGLARVSRWNPSRQVQRLQIEKISQASARQRKGRCGRVREGVCVRLYEEDCHEDRDEYTDPEIRRSSLAGVILRMKSLKLPDIEDFPFLDPPSPKHISEGYRTLREIGALSDENRLLRPGHQLARLPVEPRLGKMLLESQERRCLAELLVIVSGLSVMDPKERPQDKQQQADQAHEKWKHEDSDFMSILLLWHDLQQFKEGRRWQRNQLRKFCKKQFVNFRRVQEWDNLYNELAQLAKRSLKWEVPELAVLQQDWAHEDEIHKSILAGIPKQIGVFDREKKAYKGAQGREFAIFPGSGLFSKKKLEWVLAYEMVDTSRLWARRNAVLKPEWVEEVAPHLCRVRWHSASFDKKQGAVYAKEIVTCANLTIVDGRNVHYGRIQPEAAREVFILEGILQGGMTARPELIKQIESLRTHVTELEQKLRRVDGIWAEELLAEWFRQELPADVCTVKSFLKWTQNCEKQLTLADVCYEDVESLNGEDYPDNLEHQGEEYPLYYKTAPDEFDDGVTVGIHVDQLSLFPDYIASWGVPGDLVERVQLLIRSLPKSQRIACNPARERAEKFAEQCNGRARDVSLYIALASYLSQISRQYITVDQFDLAKVPAAMQMKFWVCDDAGNELAFAADLSKVKLKLSGLVKERFEESSSAEWEFTGMKAFDCDPLPEVLEMPQGNAYPALIDEGTSVGVKVYADRLVAQNEHRGGIIRLFLFDHFDHVKYISKSLPLSIETKMYLPLLGEKGVDQTSVVRWSVERAMGRDLPRDADAFAASSGQGRGELHEAASKVCKLLDRVVKAYREVDLKLAGWRNDEHLGEIAEDIDEQMRWLLRKEFSQQVDVWTLEYYPLWFEGMLDRMHRAKSQPLIKDLEKMDAMLDLWQPWHDHWSERRKDLNLIDVGHSLNLLRTASFCPNLKLPVKISTKVVKKKLDGVGVVY